MYSGALGLRCEHQNALAAFLYIQKVSTQADSIPPFRRILWDALARSIVIARHIQRFAHPISSLHTPWEGFEAPAELKKAKRTFGPAERSCCGKYIIGVGDTEDSLLGY